MRDDKQVRQQLSYWSKTPPSDTGMRVAMLLEEWGGLHHFEESLMSKVDWSHPFFIKMRTRGCLSTFDFNMLTRLVFLAHDHCIRVELTPCNQQFLTLYFHPRCREGSACQRHPTAEDALSMWRTSHPGNQKEPELVALAETDAGRK